MHDRFLLVTMPLQPDHHIHTYTVHRKPRRIRAVVYYYSKRLAGLSCVTLFWSVHGLHGLLGFALPSRAAGASGYPFAQMGITAHSVLYLKGNMLCAARAWFGRANSRKGKKSPLGFFFWVMVVLLSVWVCLFLLRARLD